MIDNVTIYGPAGNRRHDLESVLREALSVDYGLLKLRLEQTQEQLRHAEAAIAERDAAALATLQPVSELTEGAAFEALNIALVLETERAIEQRDKWLKTGISTASHGGSHDTCFPAILRKHLPGFLAASPVTPVSELTDDRILAIRCGVGKRYNSAYSPTDSAAIEFARALLAASAKVSPVEPVSDDKRDAERYRWLRHGDNDDLVIQRGPVAHDFVYLPRLAKLDEMIAAASLARQAKPTTGEQQ